MKTIKFVGIAATKKGQQDVIFNIRDESIEVITDMAIELWTLKTLMTKITDQDVDMLKMWYIGDATSKELGKTDLQMYHRIETDSLLDIAIRKAALAAGAKIIENN